MNEGKPAQAIDKIVDGRMEKYFGQVCLLDQAFIRDEDRTINEVITEVIGKLGEKIAVRRFTRFRVGETG